MEVLVPKSKEDVDKLISEMKKAAEAEAVVEAPIYSKTEFEAFLKAEEKADPEILSCTRSLAIGPFLIASLTLTVDLFEGKDEWHLSMLGHRPGKQVRLDDVMALALATAFLGNGFDERTEGVLKQVRHFFQKRS